MEVKVKYKNISLIHKLSAILVASSEEDISRRCALEKSQCLTVIEKELWRYFPDWIDEELESK